MSCFICTDRQISAIAIYAARNHYVSIYAPTWAGEIEHAKAIFRQLAWKNVEAFVTRYEDRHRPLRCPEWDAGVICRAFAPMALLKAAKSLRYQIAECADFETCTERELLESVIASVTCELPGFQESEGWNSL